MTPFFAAAVYTPKQADKSALPDFLSQLREENTDVAGIIQEASIKEGDKARTIEAVDIKTGHRTAIKRPMSNEDDCGLDASNLIETTAILRRAISEPPQLVIIEKFGDQEQIGEGLFDDIMQIIAEGIPLLIAVPKPALTIWQERTGEMGEVIDYHKKDMINWWQSHKANT